MNAAITSKYALSATDKTQDINSSVKFDDYDVLHNHDYFELLVCLNGEYRHYLNGEREMMKPGDAFLLRPSDEHRFCAKVGKVRHLNVMIKTSFFKKNCNNLSDSLYDLILAQEKIKLSFDAATLHRVMSYLNLLESYNNAQQDKKDLAMILSFNAILESIIDQMNLLNRDIPAWLSELMNQLSTPEALHWTVEDVVKSCNYSHTHLVRLFREYTGMTIAKYMQNIKLSYATKYLLYSEKSISEISDLLGYANVSHFNHIFKLAYNMSPVEYRKTQTKDIVYRGA